MPNTNFLSILIDGRPVDLAELKNVGIKVNYVLEEPENFERKQSSSSFGITVPATPANDKIFNTFHNPAIEDLTTGQIFRNNRAAHAYVNGTNAVIIGKALLEEAGHTGKPLDYVFNIWGGNGDWALDMQNLTLWDCLSAHTHTFDAATMASSWDFDGTSEVLDYVYAPVRYRQPFGDNDDIVTPYHLRPSISIYWLLYRAFKAVGYSIESSFFDTDYFRRMVMPWTWGDFYDINGDMVIAIGFKSVGKAAPSPIGHTSPWAGTPTNSDCVQWNPFDGLAVTGSGGFIGSDLSHATGSGVAGLFVFSFLQDALSGGTNNIHRVFQIDNDSPALGRDPFGNFTFLTSGLFPGGMQYHFNPPPAIVSTISNTVTVNFTLNLICKTQLDNSGTGWNNLALQVERTSIFGNQTYYIPIPELSFNLGDAGGSKGSLSTPTVITYSVSGVHPGDYIITRLRYDANTNAANAIAINSSCWVGSGSDWVQQYTSLEMTGLLVELGGSVNFKWYDAFKKYRVLDFIGGLIDLFDLEVQTDNVSKSVCIEPMLEVSLNSTTNTPGYFQRDRVYDWSKKQDVSKRNSISLFSGHEQQVDFTFKQDGADGGQNIWAARYKGIYLNGIIGGKSYQPGSMNNANGVLAGVPGASRYMLPNRFLQGNRQKVNRFFSATMHCLFAQWTHITGIPTQLIAIIPENINDTSASAVTQVFEPKIAYYKGLMSGLGVRVGGWRWQPNPSDPTTAANTASLPFMFSVNYSLDVSGNDGREDPVLTYCDQLINGNVVEGLMKKFFLKRLAIMRNGQLYKPWMRLNLGDISNWKHREFIFIKQSTYALTIIDDFQPLKDESCQCTMWRIVPPIQEDLDNCFPSNTSVSTSPSVLPVNDLKYASMMCLQSDIPQINT